MPRERRMSERGSPAAAAQRHEARRFILPSLGSGDSDRASGRSRERKGRDMAQRCISSESLWKWIDAHGQEFGIGRPYLDKNPPHVGPIDGQEYAEKRGRAIAESAALETNRPHRTAVSITVISKPLRQTPLVKLPRAIGNSPT